MTPAEMFQVGDRVRLIKEVQGWELLSRMATIVQPYKPQMSGAGCEVDEEGSWPIHIDGYDYGASGPRNYHSAAPSAIEPEFGAPTEEEIRALFFPEEAQGGPR